MTRRPRSARLRPALVLLSVVLFAVLFLVRLTDVQVVRAAALRTESKDRRSVTTVLPGPRGDILDADGTVLATTVTRYRVTAVPRLAVEAGRVAADADRISSGGRGGWPAPVSAGGPNGLGGSPSGRSVTVSSPSTWSCCAVPVCGGVGEV